ncbi:metallophosphoesterase [Silvanigrella aquatica]|uniref:Uncharacterized protein n=1 Tax=Silvanigrella aquatica TaxID=1915309 RepID=A0A1L4CZI0_9BACT|nr:metallophosphoesterase [Silvanigrella aquatica]APJ03364.1 hypothetical protein AXG55_05365 [Silvanigrella aquatica]
MLRKKISILFLFFSIFFIKAAYSQREYNNILAMSDIHFNPFAICVDKNFKKKCSALIRELNESEVNNWKQIFEKYHENLSPSVSGEDTNYPLFESFLYGIKEITEKNSNIRFAVILGDFLGHHFIDNFKLYSQDKLDPKKIDFIKKTYQFLTNEIRSVIPAQIEIYPVIGNNDSYIDNYNVDNPKTSLFYNDLKNIWALNSEQIKNSDSFSSGGYYSAKTKIKGLSVVALNTNPFSKKATSKDKADINKIIEEQLIWLNVKLENAKNQKILIISHIPFGIDTYSSLNSLKKGGDPVLFWKDNPNLIEKPYLKILSNHFSSIAGILVAHTHFNSFQMIDNDLELFSLTVPSVSPIHKNNPGFQIFTLNDANIFMNSLSYVFGREEKKWKELYNFDELYESQTLYVGVQSLIGKWFKEPLVSDGKFINFYSMGNENTQVKNNWNYYICAADNNLNSENYKECLNSIY